MKKESAWGNSWTEQNLVFKERSAFMRHQFKNSFSHLSWDVAISRGNF